MGKIFQTRANKSSLVVTVVDRDYHREAEHTARMPEENRQFVTIIKTCCLRAMVGDGRAPEAGLGAKSPNQTLEPGKPRI